MADTGRTHAVSQSFKSIEKVSENVNLTDCDIHDIVVQDETEADDYDVLDLSRCDDEAETPRKNEVDGNFEDFNSEHINEKTFDTQEAVRQFVCNKQGFRKLDDKKLNGNEKRRRDLRTGCEAMMQVTLSKKLGMWVVDKFQDIHNHPLTTTPSKVINHRSHSKYHRTNVCKSLVADLNNEGLKPSHIIRVVNAMNPSEEADVTSRQCSRNFWIQNMYNLRAHWAKSFLNDTFFAGMTTSGRSESIHSFFDGYGIPLPMATKLTEF
ncbi:hypothetical protein RJ639_012715 [Escallonia herrerae]|uniref:FAR1 domain-containing protein n=1 Tax=Escallonia herrerae TaxID=1293975 RepID=A0AA89AQ24_9ASTE|nr:hypothetical protein RJ639_012715 [Escallonia herrerae]